MPTSPRPLPLPLGPASLLTDALAAHRLTRLVTTDSLTEPLRAALDAHPRAPQRVRYLVTCDYCVSVWAALAVPLLPARLRRALAVAGAVAVYHEVRPARF